MTEYLSLDLAFLKRLLYISSILLQHYYENDTENQQGKFFGWS